MTDRRDLLDRIERQVPPPRFGDLLERREHKQRRARVSARLTALALTLLVLGGAWFLLGDLRHGTLPTSGNTNGAATIRNGPISFTVRDSNQWHVATVQPDGSGREILTDGVRDYGTSWSPDGTQIAYDTDQSGIWIMSSDGSHAHQVTTGNDFSPRWSPDGSRLAFSRFGHGMVNVTQGSITASHLWTVNTDGTGEKQLTSGDVSDNVGSWAPDSRQIAFARWSADGWGIWIVSADGGEAHQVVALGDQSSGSPSWSPDGRQILYTRMNLVGGNSAPRIWLVNSDGTGDHMLLDQWAEDATWSPDGSKIAYSDGDIWVMNADGANQHQVTSDPAEEIQPSWGAPPP